MTAGVGAAEFASSIGSAGEPKIHCHSQSGGYFLNRSTARGARTIMARK